MKNNASIENHIKHKHHLIITREYSSNCPVCQEIELAATPEAHHLPPSSREQPLACQLSIYP